MAERPVSPITTRLASTSSTSSMARLILERVQRGRALPHHGGASISVRFQVKKNNIVYWL